MANSRLCSVDGCSNPHDTRGYCKLHYTRWSRHGDPMFVRRRGTCSVEGCDAPHKARGFCKKHVYRLLTNGDPNVARTNAGTGSAQRFFFDVVANYTGDECLTWPFHTDRKGYAGHIYMDAKKVRSYRMSCEIENGPAPSPEHDAAHLCGRGHEGCVSRKHLAWKSRVENAADRVLHGTHKKSGWRAKPNPSL